jgi:nitroreductase
MAGSSSDSQPIRFIVMRDQAAKDRLAPAGPGTAPLVKAPLGIVICLKGGSRDFDVGRAAQNMMVAAWAEGIHSCPVGLRNETVASEALGLPEEYVASICISFGYPLGVPSGRAPGRRLPMEELVHYDGWGNQKRPVTGNQ